MLSQFFIIFLGVSYTVRNVKFLAKQYRAGIGLP